MAQDDANGGGRLLNEVESKRLLSEAGINTNATELAGSRDEAVRLAREIGHPVVLKIASPDVVHKSDAGGVRVGVSGDDAVAAAYDEIVAAVAAAQPGARVDGVSVQAMAEPGVEVIIGVSRDPQFGPLLMFGLGGVLVEVLGDVAFRIAPLTERDASEMVREIKGFPILRGHRGSPPADLEAIERALLDLSRFVDGRPDVSEVDLNPIIAHAEGLTAVDARVVLAQ